jgi:hypothetical protein
MIKDFLDEFTRYRTTGRKAIDQVSDDDLNKIFGDDNNSIAMIVRHISGNLISRFTDFLDTDGEKPWRHRDREFETQNYSRSDVIRLWDDGWKLLEQELSSLTDPDLRKQVYIRGRAHSVHEALCRSAAHVAYHVGQIVLLARILKGGDWRWISIPKGHSHEYNQNPTKEKDPAGTNSDTAH